MSGTTISAVQSTGILLTTESEEPVLVTGGGSIISQTFTSIYIAAGYPGTVTNLGVLFSGVDDAVASEDGGTLLNEGSIASGGDGVYFHVTGGGGASTVTNVGTIRGGDDGVAIYQTSGFITNGAAGSPGGLIAGARYGVAIQKGSVTNFGTIIANTTSLGAGINIYGSTDATLTNGAGEQSFALIEGPTGIWGGYGAEIYNAGTILGTLQLGALNIFGFNNDTLGAGIASPARVVNGSATNDRAVIEGAGYGVIVLGTGGTTIGTVINFGTIGASGSVGVSIVDGYVANNAMITAATGVRLSNGTIRNDGFVAATATQGAAAEILRGGVLYNGSNSNQAALLAGGAFGFSGTAGDVVNDGTVLGTRTGVAFYYYNVGAIVGVTNGSSLASNAVIDGGSYGVSLYTASGGVNNFGTIRNTGSAGAGVRLHVVQGEIFNGASAFAGGVISGVNYGIESQGPFSSVYNFGTINATGSVGTGVELNGGIEFLFNGDRSSSTASITGANYGVKLAGSDGIDEIANSGTISGNGVTGTGAILLHGGDVINSGVFSGNEAAVYNVAGSFTLTADPGAVFAGSVIDHAGTGKLLLSGNLGALEMSNSFSGFSTLGFDPGASWLLEGNIAELATGEEIYGFTLGDTLDLDGFSASAYHYVSGSGLILTNAAASETIGLTGSFSANGFSLSSDANNGTLIEEVTCFAQGTCIATESGEVPVEALQIGMAVKTLHAGLQRIKWIGRRGFAAPFANHEKLLPILIKAGAIREAVPRRDLYVSPGHAICLDGALIHAACLVNGVSIMQLKAVAEIVYYHIELENHEVIFAEGCPAETYMGECFRGQFQNAAEFAALYPDQYAPERSCLPRLEQGYYLEAVRGRLALRAGFFEDHALPGRLRGVVDVAEPGLIAGWAQDAARPEAPVSLDVILGSRRVARVLANRHRADLRRAGLGIGFSGFEVIGLASTAMVRRSLDGAVLRTAEPKAA